MPPRPSHALHRAGWLLGLPVLGLIWAGTTLYAAPEIAARLAAAGEGVARATEGGAPEPWLRVAVRGRDLVAAGEAPGPEARTAALAQLAALDGPRRIVPEIGLVETAAPFAWSATRAGPERIALAGSRPAEIGRAALRTRLAAELPGTTALDDAARAARGAPPDFSTAAAYAVARLRGLLPGAVAALSDTVLSFSGEAADLAAYDALRAALADPPQGYGLGRVDILPAQVADFRMAMTREPGGGLVLSGHVVSEEARAALGRRVAEIADGAAVDDRMRTARGLAAAIDPEALGAFMAGIVGLMQTGGVRFDGREVSAAGDAVDAQAVDEIAALLRAHRPAGVEAGAVSLATRPLAPYRVAIRREGDAVSLSGHLPDAEARARLDALVRPRFYRERILDRTRIADGAPPDLFAALGVAVPALATLAGGEIAVADRSLSLTGEGLYREAAARLAETLPRALPGGWTVRVAVRPRNPVERRDPATCRADAAALLAGTSLRFPPGSGALAPIFFPVLDRVAGLAKLCPSLRLAVTGQTDPEPAPKPAAGPAMVADAAGAQGAAAPRPPAKAADTPRPADKKALDTAAPAQKPQAKAVPETPEDLARQRALAVVEYLLQAGAGLDQVRVAEAPPARAGVALTVLP
ncbi:hypothetical protein [uncultured Methylobacterium sp.]|uniref:hypothetical protein n=1 Tax=uncultured Methylobacterium sp. TaxID=157278 RepID=UPI0035CA9932